ncbi:hypothetical protein M0R45_019501 [Rubus argutus]|uniref:Uncharacterized protein n=1 Tax=Rubus argutus TaxID=59490 RepID=A0AAW1X615_RUBAR
MKTGLLATPGASNGVVVEKATWADWCVGRGNASRSGCRSGMGQRRNVIGVAGARGSWGGSAVDGGGSDSKIGNSIASWGLRQSEGEGVVKLEMVEE